MIKHCLRHRRLHNPSINRHHAVHSRNIECVAPSAHGLGRQGWLNGVHNGLQRSKRVVGKQHMVLKNHGLLLGRETLQSVRFQGRESVIRGSKDSDSGTCFLGIELRHDPGGLHQRNQEVEIHGIYENVCDIDTGRGGRWGAGEIKAIGEDHVTDPDNADRVRKLIDEAIDRGIVARTRHWHAYPDLPVTARSYVHSTRVVGRPPGRLVQRCHQSTRGRHRFEALPVHIFKKHMVAQHIRNLLRRQVSIEARNIRFQLGI